MEISWLLGVEWFIGEDLEHYSLSNWQPVRSFKSCLRWQVVVCVYDCASRECRMNSTLLAYLTVCVVCSPCVTANTFHRHLIEVPPELHMMYVLCHRLFAFCFFLYLWNTCGFIRCLKLWQYGVCVSQKHFCLYHANIYVLMITQWYK